MSLARILLEQGLDKWHYMFLILRINVERTRITQTEARISGAFYVYEIIYFIYKKLVDIIIVSVSIGYVAIRLVCVFFCIMLVLAPN